MTDFLAGESIYFIIVTGKMNFFLFSLSGDRLARAKLGGRERCAESQKTSRGISKSGTWAIGSSF